MRAFLIRVTLRSLVGALLALALINGTIRLLGGSTALLSPRHLPQKLHALGALTRHLVTFRSEPPIEATLRSHSEAKGIPTDFVMALAQRESRLTRISVSHTGAMGVMQLMPATAQALGVRDPFSVEENIDGGTRLVAELWRRYRGDRCRVAAAYNAGPGRVPRRGQIRLPGETRHYMVNVVGPECRRLYR
ncbi:MAG: lytic transglycosylase domain-containing protein [Myxococcota bacterium]